MRAVVEASLEVEVTIRPGVRIVRSLISLTVASFKSCAETVVTTIGTSCRFWVRFCAVTTIWSIASPLEAAGAAWTLEAKANATIDAVAHATTELRIVQSLPGPARIDRFATLFECSLPG